MRSSPVTATAPRDSWLQGACRGPTLTPLWLKSLMSHRGMFTTACRRRRSAGRSWPSLCRQRLSRRGIRFGGARTRRRAAHVRTAMWGMPGDDTLQKLTAGTMGSSAGRPHQEKIFGTWNVAMGSDACDGAGLRKPRCKFASAIAYNLRHSSRLPSPHAI